MGKRQEQSYSKELVRRCGLQEGSPSPKAGAHPISLDLKLSCTSMGESGCLPPRSVPELRGQEAEG